VKSAAPESAFELADRLFDLKVTPPFPQPVAVTPSEHATRSAATAVDPPGQPTEPEMELGGFTLYDPPSPNNDPSDFSPVNPDATSLSDGETQSPPTARPTAIQAPESPGGTVNIADFGGIDTLEPTFTANISAAPARLRPEDSPRPRARLGWGSGTIFNSLSPRLQEKAKEIPPDKSDEIQQEEFLTFAEATKLKSLQVLKQRLEEGLTAEELLDEVSNHLEMCEEHSDVGEREENFDMCNNSDMKFNQNLLGTSVINLRKPYQSILHVKHAHLMNL